MGMLCTGCETFYDEWEDHECDPARVAEVRERRAAAQRCSPSGRALTPGAKRAVIERILAAWERKPLLRLGRLLHCATHALNALDSTGSYVEDERLASAVERFVADARREQSK